MRLPCRHCHLYEEEHEHHEYEPIEIPEGCVCSEEWDGQDVPAVCGSFIKGGKWVVWCRDCAHDAACHRAPEPDPDKARDAWLDRQREDREEEHE